MDTPGDGFAAGAAADVVAAVDFGDDDAPVAAVADALVAVADVEPAEHAAVDVDGGKASADLQGR